MGTGPWAWTGVAPLAFLAGGKLHTPWMTGQWGVHPTTPDAIFANFVGEEHTVRFGDCWSFESVRARDGDRTMGGAKLDPPAHKCPELQAASFHPATL